MKKNLNTAYKLANPVISILLEQISQLRYSYNELHNDIEWAGLNESYEKASAVYRDIEVIEATLRKQEQHQTTYPEHTHLRQEVKEIQLKTKRQTMNHILQISETEGDVIDILLTPQKTPITYALIKEEKMKIAGMTETEAERHLCQPIPFELFYDYGRGVFSVEAQAVSHTEIYNPYTGEEILNKT